MGYSDTPQEDLSGLSPNEMAQLLYEPFDSPELLQFRDLSGARVAAPILDLLMPLMVMLEAGPLKLTAAGNLPVKVCSALAEDYRPEHYTFQYWHELTRVTERDCPDLTVVRVVGTLSGLFTKRHGKLQLTRKGTKLLHQGAVGIYPELFRTFVGKYNWGYMDGYEPFTLVQQSWAFTCYLLQRYGNQPRPAATYSDHFLFAFPMLVAEVPPRQYGEPEGYVTSCYEIRALVRFLGFLGLARFEWHARSDGYGRHALIQASPMFADFIDFQVR